MNKKLGFLATFLISSALIAGPVLADPPGKGKKHGWGDEDHPPGHSKDKHDRDNDSAGEDFLDELYEDFKDEVRDDD